ncbi:MAG: endonuclease V [bacterium]|nr:endonuclease V [bacterium]
MKEKLPEIQLLKKVQEELRSLVITVNKLQDYEYIGGCDVSYRKNEGVGVFVVFNRQFKLLDVAVVKRGIEFPYIPGYLAFREVPFLIDSYNKLKVKPDIVLVDGQGIAHPRGFGVASHLGVLLNLPTIGVAKSRLYGYCDMPELVRGNFTYLRDRNNAVIGACLVTKDRSKPLYVSIGHLVDLDMAIKVVLENTLHYKILEPLRVAHLFTRREK